MSDILSGFTSGWAQILVGYPLDTLKVLKQNNLSLGKLSIKQVYSGVKYPLYSSLFTNAIVFSFNDRMKALGHPSYFNGFIAGLIVSPNVYFFDYMKVNTQVGNIVEKWNIKNLRGLSATFGREAIAFSIYFSTYDWMRNANYSIPLSGAMAGVTNWTFSYPLDVIRNRQIAQNISILGAIEKGKLWHGIEYCLLRAIIVNSIAFSVYENTNNYLKKYIFN